MTAFSEEKKNSRNRPLRAAALDIGSNSCRILIAEVGDSLSRKTNRKAAVLEAPGNRGEGKLRPIYYDLKTTRLAAGIEESGRLNSASRERTIAALKNFKNKLQEYQVFRCRMVGTSALREVNNARRFAAEIKAETGLELKVISGQREAELVYRGASAGLDNSSGALVIDIGGGSTEVITKKSGSIKPVSLKMGAVRFTERFITDPVHPITENEIASIKDAAFDLLKSSSQLSSLKKPGKSVLSGSGKPSPKSSAFPGAVGVGGTITSLAAVQQEMSTYCSELIEGYYLGLKEVETLIELFASRTLEERQEIPGLQAARADIITAGTAILAALLQYFQLPGIRVSEKDILYGLLREELKL